MGQNSRLSLLPDVFAIGVLEAILGGADRPFGQEKIRPLRALNVQIELRRLLLWFDQVHIILCAESVDQIVPVIVVPL